jgi:uncharacterized protein (DUF2141 family)
MKTFILHATRAFLCPCLFLAADINAGDFHPIVDVHSGILVGAAGEGEWLNDDQAAKLVRGGESYHVYGFNTPLGLAAGDKPSPGELPHKGLHVVPLVDAPKGGVIALGAKWNALPRRTRLTSTDQPVYVKAVAEFLETRGLKEPKVNITQIARVDLNGDGEEEVLISGTNYFGKQGRLSRTIPAGSYSFVLLRRVVRNSVQTQLLEGEFHPKTKTGADPGAYKISAVLDLDGDGKMEVIVSGVYFEGDSISVWSWRGTKPEKILEVAGGL